MVSGNEDGDVMRTQPVRTEIVFPIVLSPSKEVPWKQSRRRAAGCASMQRASLLRSGSPALLASAGDLANSALSTGPQTVRGQVLRTRPLRLRCSAPHRRAAGGPPAALQCHRGRPLTQYRHCERAVRAQVGSPGRSILRTGPSLFPSAKWRW